MQITGEQAYNFVTFQLVRSNVRDTLLTRNGWEQLLCFRFPTVHVAKWHTTLAQKIGLEIHGL